MIMISSSSLSLLLSLLLLIVSCSAEVLSTGENVKEFVTRNIKDNEVS
jgi:hypothetical protein